MHVAVVERAGREQYERDQTGRGPAEAAANSPGRNQSDDANRSPDQSPGLEKAEREHFGGERSRHDPTRSIPGGLFAAFGPNLADWPETVICNAQKFFDKINESFRQIRHNPI